MVEVALHELALILTRFLLALFQIGAADDEFGKHQRRRLGAVELPVQRPSSFDARHPHFPGPVGEHDDVRPQLGCRENRFVAGRDGVDAPVEGVLRPRSDFGSGLLVKLPVALDESGLQGIDDHGRGLVETLPRFVHADAESLELPARQAASEPQAQAAAAQQVQHRGVLGDPQRVVPGKDHRGRSHVNVGMLGRHVGHQLYVVRYEGVIVEMVLRRPEALEALVSRDLGQAQFFFPHQAVRPFIPAVAGEDHHHSDIHPITPCS